MQNWLPGSSVASASLGAEGSPFWEDSRQGISEKRARWAHERTFLFWIHFFHFPSPRHLIVFFFLSTFRFMGILSRKYSFCRPFPLVSTVVNILKLRGTLVKIDKPSTDMLVLTKASNFTLGFTLWCYRFSGFWQILKDMYLPYSIIQNNFTALKFPFVAPIDTAPIHTPSVFQNHSQPQFCFFHEVIWLESDSM